MSKNNWHSVLGISRYINYNHHFSSCKTLYNKRVLIGGVLKLKQRYTGIRYYLFEDSYHPFIAAIVIGLHRTLSLANECINWEKMTV